MVTFILGSVFGAYLCTINYSAVSLWVILVHNLQILMYIHKTSSRYHLNPLNQKIYVTYSMGIKSIVSGLIFPKLKLEISCLPLLYIIIEIQLKINGRCLGHGQQLVCFFFLSFSVYHSLAKKFMVNVLILPKLKLGKILWLSRLSVCYLKLKLKKRGKSVEFLSDRVNHKILIPFLQHQIPQRSKLKPVNYEVHLYGTKHLYQHG